MSQIPWYAESYERPELDAVAAQVRQYAAACAEAADAPAMLTVLEDWNRLRSNVDTQYNVAMVRYQQNTRSEQAKAEQQFWDEAMPTMRELDVLWARALIDDRYRSEIASKYGEQLIALKECAATTFDPSIKEAVAEEARLRSRYTEVASKAEVEFRGETYSMSEVAKYFADADRQTRLESQQARDRFLAANSEELDSIYHRMVELRDQMGRQLGHDNFVPLGYKLMSRSAYGPDEVATFRQSILDHIVPLAQKVHERQRVRLGVDQLLYHDEGVFDPAGNPKPTGSPEEILASAQTMYDDLSPETGEFYRMMVDRGLFDVECRVGKAGGGFCTVFADHQVPFVFANFNGTETDIGVITHECGHAYQCWSSRELPLIEYAFPTYEAAEVHSMGMEYLTYPYMELFFAGDDAERYRRVHSEKRITTTPYTAVVDHFQHRVYEEPNMTPAQRNEMWLEMERLYMPHRNYGGLLPYLETGTLWQRQLHIYGMPFYYIDYALAEICALQIWMKSEADRDKALADYHAICRVGGKLSFTDMLELGNLRSPFDPDCMRDVAKHLARELDLE